MAKAINLLSGLKLADLPPDRHKDGGGLFFIKRESGAASWQAIIYVGGRPREMGLGVFPTVKLAEARRARDEAKALALKGVDPTAARRADRVQAVPMVAPAFVDEAPAACAPAKPAGPTFGPFADTYIREHIHGSRGKKTVPRWELVVRVYAAPIRDKALDAITDDDALAILRPMREDVPALADKAQNYLERLLDAAIASRLRTDRHNPFRWRGHLKLLLPKRRAKLQGGHHKALPWADGPAFLAALRQREGVGARALEFTVLEGVRTDQTLGARWGEFNLTTATWTVPLDRCKNAEKLADLGFDAFAAPLSSPALALLKERKASAELRLGRPVAAGDLVFPNHDTGERLSCAGMDTVLKRMGLKDVATVHGFRATFRSWAGQQRETRQDGGKGRRRWPRELLEWSLGHIVASDTELAYDREDYLDERRDVLEAWAAYLTASPVAANDGVEGAPDGLQQAA